MEGFWIYAKVNPYEEVIKAVSSLSPNNNYILTFHLASVVVNVLYVALVYGLGEIIGLIALALAFLGGIFIGKGIFGVTLVFSGMFSIIGTTFCVLPSEIRIGM